MKAGDLLPALVIDVTDLVDGVVQPVNLTSATAVRVLGIQGVGQAFDDTSPTRDNANGVVTHNWVAGETDTVGRIWVDVIVTWPGGKPQHFPVTGSLPVDIDP